MGYNTHMKTIKIYNLIKLDKAHQIYFFSLSIMSLLYILPIILADRYYNDDLSRSLIGASGWNGDGRPLTERIMLAINFGRPVADISPFPLILSAIILSYCITLYIKHNLPLTKNKSVFFILLFAGFLVISNPFLIADLSYKYDCLTMVLSVCLAFLAYSFSLSGIMLNLIMNLCCVLMILCLFQPSIGLYASLFFLEPFIIMVHKRSSVKQAVKSVSVMRIAGGLTAVIIYIYVIAPFFVDNTGWRANASKISVSFNTITSKLDNILFVIKRYVFGLPKSALFPFILLLLISFISLVVYSIVADTLFKNRFLYIVYILFLPVIMFFAGIAPLLVLKNAQINDHVLTGLCAVTPFILGIAAFYTQGFFKKLVIILIIPCIIFKYSYIYAYSSALKSQKNYESFIVQNVAESIQKEDIQKECNLIGVSYYMPKSRQLQTLCDKYPQFQAIVPVYMYGENWIGTSYLNHYLQQQLMFEELNKNDMAFIEDNEPFSDNSIYSLYRNDNKILLIFRQ